MILQLRHATFNTQSLKEIHSGRETGLIDTGPLQKKKKKKKKNGMSPGNVTTTLGARPQ